MHLICTESGTISTFLHAYCAVFVPFKVAFDSARYLILRHQMLKYL